MKLKHVLLCMPAQVGASGVVTPLLPPVQLISITSICVRSIGLSAKFTPVYRAKSLLFN